MVDRVAVNAGGHGVLNGQTYIVDAVLPAEHSKEFAQPLNDFTFAGAWKPMNQIKLWFAN